MADGAVRARTDYTRKRKKLIKGAQDFTSSSVYGQTRRFQRSTQKKFILSEYVFPSKHVPYTVARVKSVFTT